MAKKTPLELAKEAVAAAAAVTAQAAAELESVKAKADSTPEQVAAAEAALADAQAVEAGAKEALEAEEAKAAPAAPAAPAGAKAAEPAFVPVLKYDDEPIKLNSKIRLITTKANYALTDLNGNRITSERHVEVLGTDIRDGDWYTTQYKAGLLTVDAVKSAK